MAGLNVSACQDSGGSDKLKRGSEMARKSAQSHLRPCSIWWCNPDPRGCRRFPLARGCATEILPAFFCMEDFMALNSVNLTFLPSERGKILCPYCSQAAEMENQYGMMDRDGNVFLSLRCRSCERSVILNFWAEAYGVHVEAITD